MESCGYLLIRVVIYRTIMHHHYNLAIIYVMATGPTYSLPLATYRQHRGITIAVMVIMLWNVLLRF